MQCVMRPHERQPHKRYNGSVSIVVLFGLFQARLNDGVPSEITTNIYLADLADRCAHHFYTKSVYISFSANISSLLELLVLRGLISRYYMFLRHNNDDIFVRTSI